MRCSKPLTYACTTLIALVAAISVTAVASVVCGLDRRDINSGTIVIVANASALIHSALARWPRPACVTSVAAPLTSNTQAVPPTLAISPRVAPLTLVIRWRAATLILAINTRAAPLTLAVRTHAASAAIAGHTFAELTTCAIASCVPRLAGLALAAAMIRGLAVFNAVLVTLGR
ncbi:hypothetical protein IQ286_22280 [Burkholderia sp. R-69749]|nr:hypothetical protein [Burkholderia sp. R-69749]